MGGLMVGGAVLGGIMGQNEAQAQAAKEMAQYNDRTIKEAFNSGKQLFGIANANAMKRLQNEMNAEAMARNYARGRIDLQKNIEDRRQAMAENQRLTVAANNIRITQKMGTNSGTAERIREQMKHKGAKNWETEFFNTLDQEKAMEQQYRNNLNQIDDSMAQADAYMPGMMPQPPNMTASLISGAMSGLAQGAQLGSAVGGAVGNLPSGGGPQPLQPGGTNLAGSVSIPAVGGMPGIALYGS